MINNKPLIKKRARKERRKENDRPSGASVEKPAERYVVFLVLLLFCLSVSLLDDDDDDDDVDDDDDFCEESDEATPTFCTDFFLFLF